MMSGPVLREVVAEFKRRAKAAEARSENLDPDLSQARRLGCIDFNHGVANANHHAVELIQGLLVEACPECHGTGNKPQPDSLPAQLREAVETLAEIARGTLCDRAGCEDCGQVRVAIALTEALREQEDA